MVTLYDISAQVRIAFSLLEHAVTEDDKLAARDTLESLEIGQDQKLVACCSYLKNLEAECEIFQLEAKRLKAEAEARERKAENFKKYLEHCIGHSNEWSNGVHAVKWRKSSAVKVLDEQAIPAVYMRENYSYEPDKAEITKALKSGATIPGVILEEKENISIK